MKKVATKTKNKNKPNKPKKAEEPVEATKEVETTSEDLIPKAPARLAPQGIRTFTVFRNTDETGVSGDGIVIEGVELATGQCIVHWLYPPPRGGIAIFESINDFIKVHIGPHPANKTIITFQDGEQLKFGVQEEETQ